MALVKCTNTAILHAGKQHPHGIYKAKDTGALPVGQPKVAVPLEISNPFESSLAQRGVILDHWPATLPKPNSTLILEKRREKARRRSSDRA